MCRQVINSLLASDGGLETRCPINFALLIRQYGSRPETIWERESRGWHDPPLYHQVRAVACAMQISSAHPAVHLGIIDRGPVPPSLSHNTASLCAGVGVDPAIQNLALQAEQSLEAILRTWELRQKQCAGSPKPPPWLIVFGLLIAIDGTVTIVAHFPKTNAWAGSEPRSGIRFCSCVVDKIQFHPEVWYNYDLEDGNPWNRRPTDDTWITDRLRISLASFTLVTNSRLVSAIWDDIVWPREILEATDELEKQHAQWDRPTPNPSEDSVESDPLGLSTFAQAIWGAELERMSGDEESDEEERSRQKRGALEASRLKVLEWRSTFATGSE